MKGKVTSPQEQLFSKIEMNGINGCWNWLAYKIRTGYGQVRIRQRCRVAHRATYELFNGPIPPGLTLDHLCRNRGCVNPLHLEPVTLAENQSRGNTPHVINARKTHCSRGHEFNEKNTYRTKSNDRDCRVCHRIRERRRLRKFRVTE